MEILRQRVQLARAIIHVSPHVAAEGVCKKSFFSHILYNLQNILDTNNPPYEPYILTIFYQTWALEANFFFLNTHPPISSRLKTAFVVFFPALSFW